MGDIERASEAAPPPEPAGTDASLDDQRRKAELLVSVIRTMVVVVTVGGLVSLLDPDNDRRITAVFYAAVYAALFWLSRVVRRGRVQLVGAAISGFFWLLIAFVILFFGGMKGENAATFGVCVMLAGALVGGQAAVVVAVVSVLWCAVVAWLELHQSLPRQLGTYSPINGWAAVTVMLIMVSVLLRNSLASLRAMNAQANESARERDEALRRSIQAQKMELVGNLASGVAHDFNNLLTVIRSASEGLREVVPEGTPEAPELLDDLDAATSRAVLMTRQLLSFGRPHDAALAPVDVGPLVRDLEPMLRRLVGASITVEVEVACGAVVLASRVGFEQILLNLAVNARDAMPKGGVLALSLGVEGAHAVLRVRDTGTGMDAATQARIFAPFFSTKATGTGLGLATVSDLVRRFGGSIHVASAPGAGATFTIRLPRAETAARVVSTAPPAAAAARRPQRILLAEDDVLVRRATVRLLEQANLEVVAVTNGAEALALLQPAHGFTCVVSDVVMPVMDGEAFAARLAEVEPSLPLVLMSGNRQPKAELVAAPHRAFVEKPVDAATLLGAIDDVQRA